MIVCFKWDYQHICSVNNATLNRFFSLHFVLPFVLAALALMHLIVLHDQSGWLITGPKFLYIKSTPILLKTSLSFILPNTRAVKRIGPHNQDVISLLVGSLLGDAHGEREKSGGVRFRFRQSVVRKDYIFWLHNFLHTRGYCSNLLPVLYTQKTGDKVLDYYRFGSYRFTSLMWLYKTFYNNKKNKVIPENIADLLTPLALAIWIASSSKVINDKVVLSTEISRERDINILVLTLKDSFGLVCSIHKCRENYYNLTLDKKYVKILQTIVAPYSIPGSKERIGFIYISKYYYEITPSNSICKRFYSTNEKSNNSTDIRFSEAVASYSNPVLLKEVIYKENQKKAGIYRWTNLVSGKTYIGSSANLAKRFSGYLSTNFLKRESLKTKSMIYYALLKYGYSNFKLEVLEYCDSNALIAREQEYLDYYLPEYNILRKAGSSLGFVHSQDTIAKFKEISRNRVYSEERKAEFARLNLNRTEEFKEKRLLQLLELNMKKGHQIEVLNISTNETNLYSSIRQAASALNISHNTIRRHLESGELFKCTYKFSKV